MTKSDYQKYLKYKKKYLTIKKHLRGGGLTEEEAQNLINSVKKVTLKAGSILYRSQPVECTNKKCLYDADTGKTGVYFSNGINIPLGMILEYNKPMYLCSYETKEDIDFFVGKFSFRELEPNRFFTEYYASQAERNQLFKINTDPENSYNHVDGGAFPLHDIFDDDIWYNEDGEKEYFITEKDINKIELLDNNTNKIKYDEAFSIIKTYKEKLLENEYN